MRGSDRVVRSAKEEINPMNLIGQVVMTSYVLPTPNFIQESIVTQIKRLVQHSSTATQAVQAFMICKTGSCNVLVHR